MNRNKFQIPVVILASYFFLAACNPTHISPTQTEPIQATFTETNTEVALKEPPPSDTPVTPTTQSPTLPFPSTSTSLTPTLIPGHAPDGTRLAVPLFFEHGDRSKPWVALTFDLCQKPAYPAGFDQGIVDMLVRYQVPATFFMGGDWMATHMPQTRLLASYPLFEMGNHSWDHPDDMRALDEEHMHIEMMRTQDMLFQLTGRTSRLFRPPTGYYNDLLLSVAAYHGLAVIRWDADSADPTPGNSAENIAKLVHERAQNGSIVLMHANGRGWNTAAALPLMIEDLRHRGFVLVSVPQIIGLDPGPTPTVSPGSILSTNAGSVY